MTTKYPSSIDGYAQIRVARDGIDSIIAGDHNDLRSAILAIERTLGVNPQGPFGTVVARLNDAYSNIEAHVLGNPPRHQDSVIMSPLRTGSITGTSESLPYSLSAGTLSSQIGKILEYLNDSIMYYGSGASTFADGYALPTSLVRSAITQIIAQLGGNTGTRKVKGEQLISSNFGNISLGQLKTQLQSLLDLIDAFGDPTGAGSIGAAPFDTKTDKYQFSSNDAQAQIEEAGDFLDEGARFREKAFNAFVVEGMAVSQSGINAVVADGYVASNGRLLKYSGGTININAFPDTYYIYAKISNGVVSVSSSSSLPTVLDPTSPSVILHRITHNGIGWDDDVDLRRFGVFVNDKNYISVGNGTYDGYGCDFISLKSAVEYARTLSSGNEFIQPLKIILASDISITSSSEMEIQLDIEGIEIDGCGRKITTSVDSALFNINNNNVTLKDIVMESDLAASGSDQCLATIGNTSSVEGITIVNCKVTKSGGTACTYFLRLGNSGATTTVSKSVITDNVAEIEEGGIEYVSTNKYVQVLQDSIISGNNIYQTTFSYASYAGIRASIHCIICDNIIKGGFNTGILLSKPTQCRVDNNLIIGYSSAITYMSNGISIWNNAAGEDNGCSISNNTIKGIADYGINCKAGTGSGAFILVSNNFIDNYYNVGSPSNSMIGIRGRGAETWVVGNKITAPGDYGIQDCSHAIGNQIYGESSLAFSGGGIAVSTSVIGVVSNNVIRNMSGFGIDGAGNSGLLISNNILYGNSNCFEAIKDVSSDSIISGNYISNYASFDYAIELSSAGTNISINGNKINDLQSTSLGAIYVPGGWTVVEISNNIIDNCPKIGFDFDDATQVLCSNNIMNGNADSTGAILNVGSNSIISNNNIKSYCIALPYTYVIYTTASASNVVISDNNIKNHNGIGIDVNNGTNFIVTNNAIEGNDSDVAAAHGITNIEEKSIVSGNLIKNANKYGINIVGNEVLCSNNFIDSPKSDGIVVSAERVSVLGNYVYLPTGNCIEIVGGGCCCLGNVLYGASGSGIDATGSGSICSNIVLGAGIYGVYIQSSSDYSIVSGNLITTILSTGIYSISSDSVNISNNCALNIFGTAILLNTCNYSSVFNNNINTCNLGIDIDTSTDCAVFVNYLYDTTSNSIQVSGTGASVNSNYIFNPGARGVLLQASATYASVQGNYIWSPTNEGIRAETGANQLLINGNMIRVSGNSSINLTGNIFACITNNYIYNPTNSGIVLNNSNGSNINGNWVFSPGDFGIYVGGTSSGCIVNSNWIRDSVDPGISFNGSANEGVCVGNFLARCGGNGSAQISLASVDEWVCVGNNVATPTHVSSDGIDMSSSDGGLCTGNRSEAGSSAKGIDYTGATNYVIEGNMSRGGSNPGGFSGLPLLGNDNGFA